jgi:hypothetical protein
MMPDRGVRSILTPLVLLAPIQGACASYTPQPVKLLRIDAATSTIRTQQLALGATLLVDPEQSKHLFQEDLKQKDILAVQIVVQNRSPHPIEIRRDNFSLHLNATESHAPVPPERIAERLERHVSVLGWTLGFGIVGYGASSLSAAQHEIANSMRLGDLRTKEFGQARVAPEESARGLLFFVLQDAKDLTGAELRLAVLSATGTPFNIGLVLRGTEAWRERNGSGLR